MELTPEIKKQLEDLQKAYDAERKTSEELALQVKKINDEDAVTKAKMVNIEAAIASAQSTIEIMEKAAARAKITGAMGEKFAEIPGYSESYTKAFDQYLRSGKGSFAERCTALETEIKSSELITKTSVAIGAGSTGGYAVPTEVNQAIDKIVLEFSPFRQNVDVIQVGTINWTTLVDLNGTATAWTAESGSITNSANPTLASVAPTFGKLWAFPRASEESLTDTFFDVASWLASRVAEAFAAAESVAILTGNGTNKPTGILNTAPVATTDKNGRTFGTLQYIPTGAAAAFGAVPGDNIIDLIYALKTAYRANAKFYMNRLTQATLRKVKNSYGDYLWQPGMANGQPNTLMGYPIVESQDVADIAANAFPILFGDLKQAYVLADRVGLSTLVDPYTLPGSVNFYTRKRMGGILKKDEALKVLKIAVS